MGATQRHVADAANVADGLVELLRCRLLLLLLVVMDRLELHVGLQLESGQDFRTHGGRIEVVDGAGRRWHYAGNSGVQSGGRRRQRKRFGVRFRWRRGGRGQRIGSRSADCGFVVGRNGSVMRLHSNFF